MCPTWLCTGIDEAAVGTAGLSLHDALALHDELIHEAVLEAGGHMVRHTVDGACAELPSASAALAAALAAHGLLLRAPRLAGSPLAVRMALLDAPAGGETPAAAARLLARARGGQVLVAGSVAANLALSPFDGGGRLVAVHDEGGDDAPALQLVHPDLASDGRAPRAAASRTNLRPSLTSFLGRSDDLEALAALAGRARLLTLVGPGGVGKTRLAREWRWHLRPAIPTGPGCASWHPWPRAATSWRRSPPP